jgi:hypothetical protein
VTAAADDSDGQRQCARADWCADPRIIRHPDGTTTRLPALVYQAFCQYDRSMIAHCLTELPAAHARLEHEIGEHPTRDATIRTPFGPVLPLRADVDALIRDLAAVLGSWHERTAAVASLTAPATSVRELGRQITAAAAVLAAHLDVLLALPPEPMHRVMHPLAAEDHWDIARVHGIVRPDGQAHMLLPLSGADAGNEILRLHYRARSILGETRAAPESFDGVPCRNCEDMALERAEPPSDPAQPAMHSRCATCGHTMDRRTFAEWAKWYATWADRAGLACRRCTSTPPRCAECVYPQCACRARGHAVIAAGI